MTFINTSVDMVVLAQDGVSSPYTPWLVYLKNKSPQNPSNRTLGGSQSQSGCFKEEKNLLPLPAIEP